MYHSLHLSSFSPFALASHYSILLIAPLRCHVITRIRTYALLPYYTTLYMYYIKHVHVRAIIIEQHVFYAVYIYHTTVYESMHIFWFYTTLYRTMLVRATGNKPVWDFATTFKIIVDDFLLRYLATDVITLELNMVISILIIRILLLDCSACHAFILIELSMLLLFLHNCIIFSPTLPSFFPTSHSLLRSFSSSSSS